jgi:BMFP domain-containing protein YqiC
MSRDNMTNGLGEMVKQLRQDNEKMMQRIAELEKKNNSATANSSS